MSEGQPAPAASSEGSTSSKHPSNHLNLRVTYLIAGNPRPPHDLGLVPASTTVAELKARLQQELLEHPQPHEQRLIYQGRPLMQSSATLREALRLEGPIGPLPYTVHIIISSRPASSHFRPSHPLQTSQQDPNNNEQPTQNPPLPAQQMDPHSTLEQAQRVQAMAQAQLNMMQQQMAMFNPALAQAMGHMPPNFNATIQIQGQQIVPTHHHHNHHHRPTPTNPFEQGNATQASAGQHEQEQTQNEPPSTRPHPDRPNATLLAQQARGGLDAHADPLAGLRHTHGLDPMPRSSSAPGHPPPHPQRPPQAPIHGHAPSMARSGQPFGPVSLPFPPQSHLPFPFVTTGHHQSPSASYHQPTVWLASSPNGPQALLFAPGQGYYTSAPAAEANTAAALPTTTSTITATNEVAPTPTVAAASQPTATARAPQPANAAAGQPPARPEPNGQVARIQRQLNGEQNANIDNEDIFAFIIQRGWLFLRLYMFMFVLSEPGTWRRYLLLFLAVIVCILPRRNPLNNAFAAARRHVDNLIGPPHPQPRDRLRRENREAGNQALPRVERGARRARDASAQRDNAAQAGPSTATSRPQPQGAVNTTPEETAQRLLREHEQRNPNVMLNFFYRIEQAVALFLASLIPGVGERHVAAREEVRREEERARLEEQARREAEEQKAREELETKQQEEAGADADADASAEAGLGSEGAGPSGEEKGKEKEVISPSPLDHSGGESSKIQAGSSSAVQTRHEQGQVGDVRARFT